MDALEHHNFITLTDRKSLFTQIKGLVAQAQEVATEDLRGRRRSLQRLLEYEDKIYEEEFANKVKSRIGEDIKERKETLLKIKEANTRSSREYLESKRIQQNMNNCYEIREALRRKEMQTVQQCQLEQIDEKARAQRRERELDRYWVRVQQTNLDREDCRQRGEDCLKRELAQQTRQVLDAQLAEQGERRAEEARERQQEVERIAGIVEELRLEEFDRQHKGLSPRKLRYREELLAEVERKRLLREAEECERAALHRQMVADLQALERSEAEALRERRRAAHAATLEYIAYVRRMRQLEADAQRRRDDRVDEQRRVDTCTKNNIQRERQRKAAVAAACHAELRRQICEQYERRLREDLERRECRIVENRFARPAVTREQVLAQRSQMRRDLDAQLAELQRLRGAEEQRYRDDLERAHGDPEFCARLAEQYVREGTDYLEPHANWRILACPAKQYVPKAMPPYPLCQDQDQDPDPDAPEAAAAAEPGDCVQSAPCGCAARVQMDCALRNLGGSGDRR